MGVPAGADRDTPNPKRSSAMHLAATLATILIGGIAAALPPAAAQEVLPFPPKPSGSIANETMQDSVYAPLPPERHLPEDAPNILIVLIDDAGPALPEVFGGEIATPALERIVNEGIAYNRFHTTAMCSPTRAALLTGRNAHRVGSGQITELANDWDGYSGTIPKSSATAAEVLRHYGYATAAFGKWHNTPALETGPTGPFDFWPTGYGFEYFYGFLAGEASQWEPRLVRNSTIVHPPRRASRSRRRSSSPQTTDSTSAGISARRSASPTGTGRRSPSPARSTRST
jgi:hypothetical protein